MKEKISLVVLAMIAMVVLFLAVYNDTQKRIEYTAVPEVQAPQQVIKQEDMLESRIKQAQEAKKGEIEIEAQKAKDASIKQALLEIELEVTTTYRKEIEAKEKELQAQSVAY